MHLEDCLASGDEDSNDDEPGDGATVNTSLRTEYAPMMRSPGSTPPVSTTPRGKWQERCARYRVLEFTLSLGAVAFAGVLSLIGVYDRPIPRIEVKVSATQTVWARDPSIDQVKLQEQVPLLALMVGATLAPILVNLFINYVLPKVKRVRVIPFDTRDFLLSMAQSAGISQVLTQFMKNMTGRFRPSFYAMCKWDYSVVWDGVTNLCQDKRGEKEGRKSFPSGHASYAMCTLFLLTLYLMGRSRLNCENRDESILRGGRKTLKLFVCFAPTLVAAWVAITRSVDNWHHYADILTGSMIGAVAAGFGYSYNYGSIFSWDSAGVPNQEYHSRRKQKDREHQDVIALLTSSQSQEVDMLGNIQSHSNASYATANASSGKGTDVVLNVK